VTKNLDVILDEDPLFAEELRILGQKIQAGEISQIGLGNFEAGELEAEIEQQITRQPQATTEQVGVRDSKITGKAIIKLNQTIL
jgi:diketogulonate reductase-like aldo/keto reductase